MRGRIVSLWAALALATAPACAAPVDGWLTTEDGARRLEHLPAGAITGDGLGDAVITVDPRRRYQVMTGFGAAMTDASAEILMHRMTVLARRALLADLFGRHGLALNLLRVPIGATDFSLRHYSLDDQPAGAADPELGGFTMVPALEAQIPALKAARAVNPALVLMASPWSAPAWMKDSGRLNGGHLLPADRLAFARYLVRYLVAMRRLGLPVGWLSVQNEPDFEPADYPGMKLTAAERAALIADDLGPLLRNHVPDTRLLDWDHNWDKPENPLAVLADRRAARYVAGVAWHCYAGAPRAMALVHTAHPEKTLLLSECSLGDWAPEWGATVGWVVDNLLIAPARAGSRGTMLWNLVLDEKHGPHLGGCGNCRGVVTVDSRTGAITRNADYVLLGHLSRFVRPGARRVFSDEAGRFTDVAFRNRDGTLVLLAHNRAPADSSLCVRERGRRFCVGVPGGGIATFRWHPGELPARLHPHPR